MVEAQRDEVDAALEAEPRRFRRYPEYRDSGVEWLGEVPAHWNVARLGHVVAGIEQGWSPLCESREADSEEWGVLKVGCVNYGTFSPTENKALPPHMNTPLNLEVRTGDVLMSRANTRELVGSAALVASTRPKLLLCDKLFRIAYHSASVDPLFLVFVLQSGVCRYQLEREATGASGSMQNIPQSLVRQLIFGWAPLAEQRAIATWLDRETAKIDALIAKKERLIELLQEQRAALITQAVTKGLEPNVPMKDSGVEWLGDIPAHWSLHRLRNFVPEIEQGWSPECEAREAELDEWGVLKAGCVNHGTFIESEHKALPAHLAPPVDLEIFAGDLLMSRASGSRELVGSVAVVPRCRPRLLLCDKVFRLRVRQNIADVNFVALFLNSRAARWQVERALSGGSGLANNIPQDVVKNMVIPVPPLPEQVALAKVLRAQESLTSTLAQRVGGGLFHLRELRTALITAAVMGKIDVREEVA